MRGFLRDAHFNAKREGPRLARSKRPHPNHTPIQNFPLGILDLDEHRVFPGSFVPGMPDDTLNAEGADCRLRGSWRSGGVKSETALARRAACGALENPPSAMGTTPPLAHPRHARLP